MSRQVDLVGVLERIYRLDDATDEEWLRGVCEAADPHFNEGRGVYGYLFDARCPEDFQLSRFVALDHTVVSGQEVASWHRALEPDLMRSLYWHSGSYGTVSQRLGLDARHPAMQRLCVGSGVRDQLVMRAIEPDLRGLVLGAPLSDLGARSRPERRRWARITAHVAAAHRLRRHLAHLSAGPDEGDAVLRPDGRVEHASGGARSDSAREALREGVKRVDRARSRLRREDPDRALDAWQGLVSGRWSLVDHFESDGRRYIMARRNAPGDPPDPRALSAQERRVARYLALGLSHKEIAYAMGLEPSTVGTHVGSAARKLGVSSRLALVHLLQRMGVP